jgi:protein-S-isoprenylcysteine O-methyltransferase Ste14
VEFLNVRLTMFKEESREKAARLKLAAPLALLGLVLLGTAFIVITIAIAAAVAALFIHSSYRWAIGFGIVGILWAILGGIAAYFAKRELEVKTLIPQRTIRVLKEDKVWFQKEVRTKP